MKISISFKMACQQDIDFLLNLRVCSMDEHLIQAGIKMSETQHLSRINEYFNDSHLILVNGEAVGLLKLGVLKQSLHIRQFQLLPNYQSRGIGSRVLAMIKTKAIKLNKPITLNVLLKNPAFSLYGKQGFKVIGENELEYQMKCSLSDCQ